MSSLVTSLAPLMKTDGPADLHRLKDLRRQTVSLPSPDLNNPPANLQHPVCEGKGVTSIAVRR
jgi:hypothetical protein